MFKDSQIIDLMKYDLINNFKLYDECHKINVPKNTSKLLLVNYRTRDLNAQLLRDTTHFDLQLGDNICYILWIEVKKSKRGNGYGWELYDTVHKFARDLGSKVVRLTPSGWTWSGESRRDYLLRKGYVSFSDREIEFIL